MTGVAVPAATRAVIGGSGSLAADFPGDLHPEARVVDAGLVFDTPWGESPPFTLFELGGERALHVGMHGWRAGVSRGRASRQVFSVLHRAGVRRIVSDAGVGSLNHLLDPGDLVVVDDFVDMTTDRDRYGRMLRYAHVDDIFINEALVADGLAIARRYPPDTGQADVLESAQADAKAAKLGMWGDQACGSTAAGADHMELSALRADPPGDDNADLNGEWVELTNTSDASIDLTGWGIKDESASHRYSFPNGFELKAGATVRLSTGCGTDEARRLYWCMTNSAVWNNSGDTAFLLDPNGNITDTYRYDDTGERRS